MKALEYIYYRMFKEYDFGNLGFINCVIAIMFWTPITVILLILYKYFDFEINFYFYLLFLLITTVYLIYFNKKYFSNKEFQYFEEKFENHPFNSKIKIWMISLFPFTIMLFWGIVFYILRLLKIL